MLIVIYERLLNSIFRPLNGTSSNVIVSFHPCTNVKMSMGNDTNCESGNGVSVRFNYILETVCRHSLT